MIDRNLSLADIRLRKMLMFVVWPRRSKGKLFFQKEKKMLKTQGSVVARPVSAMCPLGAQSLCLCLWFLTDWRAHPR